jgi:hypothetical protein
MRCRTPSRTRSGRSKGGDASTLANLMSGSAGLAVEFGLPLSVTPERVRAQIDFIALIINPIDGVAIFTKIHFLEVRPGLEMSKNLSLRQDGRRSTTPSWPSFQTILRTPWMTGLTETIRGSISFNRSSQSPHWPWQLPMSQMRWRMLIRKKLDLHSINDCHGRHVVWKCQDLVFGR